jgi:hypothetical protein
MVVQWIRKPAPQKSSAEARYRNHNTLAAAPARTAHYTHNLNSAPSYLERHQNKDKSQKG